LPPSLAATTRGHPAEVAATRRRKPVAVVPCKPYAPHTQPVEELQVVRRCEEVQKCAGGFVVITLLKKNRVLADRIVPAGRNEVVAARRRTAGVPDLNGSLYHQDAWVELKMLSKNGLKLKHDLSGPQISWLKKRWDAGGRTYIWAYHEESAAIYCWRGKDAYTLYKSKFFPFLEDGICFRIN